MATVISYATDKATRVRRECESGAREAHIGTANTRDGAPILEIEARDEQTGRRFKIVLSKDETASVMRIMQRGGGYGMGELRAKFAGAR